VKYVPIIDRVNNAKSMCLDDIMSFMILNFAFCVLNVGTYYEFSTR
jgi:hypothetical protein